MKKAVSLLFTLALALSAIHTLAFADIVSEPLPTPPDSNHVIPVLLISLAVIVIAVVLWRIRRQKK